MNMRTMSLSVSDGRVVTCQVAGYGASAAYIGGGLGSFYLSSLSNMYDVYTFYSCNFMWTYGKFPDQAQTAFHGVTTADIQEHDHVVVTALKKALHIETMDGFGFSVPGGLMLEHAVKYPEDFRAMIATGIGLIDLDPRFEKTNTLFYQHASIQKHQAFLQYQQAFTEWNQHVAFESDQTSFTVDHYSRSSEHMTFFGLNPTRTHFKPHHYFLAETVSNVPKILHDHVDADQSKQTIIHHWKKDGFKNHIDKRFQHHFFNVLSKNIHPLEHLKILAEQGKPILLIYGISDYITPLTGDTKRLLKPYENIWMVELKGAGHMPYVESPRAYAECIVDFNKNRDRFTCRKSSTLT